jgi:hypothetical protein
MRLRYVRLLTAIVMIGLCAVGISRGWNLIRFSSVKAGLSPSQNAASILGPWTTVPGVATAALESSATTVTGPTDVQGSLKRVDELAGLLSVQPMSSANWLSLSSMRLVTGQVTDKVLSALAMSSITGPNEDDVMIQRGLFGLLQWESIPSDVRRRTITDVAGAILLGEWTDRERGALTGVVKPKSAETRKEIADQLRIEGVPEKELGLLAL